jgi:hypothetical protein
MANKGFINSTNGSKIFLPKISYLMATIILYHGRTLSPVLWQQSTINQLVQVLDIFVLSFNEYTL